MTRIHLLFAAAALSLAALPATAQTRSLFDQPEAQDQPAARSKAQPKTQARPSVGSAPPSPASQEQERFVERIQRSDKRATASICADDCRGELKGRTQPKDPFAALPDYGDELPTGYVTEP
jgi:hypothetical protein